MVILTNEQQVKVAVAFKTAAGNPAPVDGHPGWSVSGTNVLQVISNPDGFGATVVALGLGTAQVSVKADADLGAGENLITGILDVQVISAPAAQVVLTPGTPEVVPLVISIAPNSMTPEGFAHFLLALQPSTTYTIEAADVVTGPWAAIGTVTTDATGVAEFLDTDAPNHTMRFYILRWPA